MKKVKIVKQNVRMKYKRQETRDKRQETNRIKSCVKISVVYGVKVCV